MAVSLVIRRWGAEVGGVLGGLPVVAGPILLVESLLHGRTFGAEAAEGTLLALAALATFVVVFAKAAGAFRPLGCALAGWVAYLIAVALLGLLSPPAGVSLLFVGLVFAVFLRVLPVPKTTRSPGTPSRWDLPGRAGAALVLVLVLTALSGSLGSHVSGLLAPFPIITSVLAVFTYARLGTAPLATLLRSFLWGFYGFAAFCFVLAVTLRSLSAGGSFALASGVALLVQVVLVFVRRAYARVGSGARTAP